MFDDPIETEQWLALNAYLCFCSAWGCFFGSMQADWIFGVYLNEMMAMGGAFSVAGLTLIMLADFKVPTEIWKACLKNNWFAK